MLGGEAIGVNTEELLSTCIQVLQIQLVDKMASNEIIGKYSKIVSNNMIKILIKIVGNLMVMLIYPSSF